MAEVYKATHTLPGGGRRTVVVKRILPVLSHNAAFMRLFVAEAQVLGLLHHPNVVQAYDFGESDGTLFLVLEYVEGPSVSSALLGLRAAGQRMPPVAAAHFASEVCRALEYVHALKGGDGEALNIIHRDVTPSNIVLTLSGGIKLLDFGVAKYRASQARTLEGTIKGKAAYVAPETLEGKPIDHRVDIFSLGIVLHEMLTLQSLFESDNQALTFRKILELPIAPPSASRPAIPPELDAIVMKALERIRSALRHGQRHGGRSRSLPGRQRPANGPYRRLRAGPARADGQGRSAPHVAASPQGRRSRRGAASKTAGTEDPFPGGASGAPAVRWPQGSPQSARAMNGSMRQSANDLAKRPLVRTLFS